eukprot:6186282-Prymnesium_polylepis.1
MHHGFQAPSTYLRRPKLARLDGHMLARLEHSLELRPQGLCTCLLIGEPSGGCAGDCLLGANKG